MPRGSSFDGGKEECIFRYINFIKVALYYSAMSVSRITDMGRYLEAC
jgi:hypothetical protein